MHLYLIVGRISLSDNNFTTMLIPATDECAAQEHFEAQLTEGYDEEERAETSFEYDVSVLVGTYTGPDTLQVPARCDWHLSSIQGAPL